MWAPAKLGLVPIVSEEVAIGDARSDVSAIVVKRSREALRRALVEAANLDDDAWRSLSRCSSHAAAESYSLAAWTERFQRAVSAIIQTRSRSTTEASRGAG